MTAIGARRLEKEPAGMNETMDAFARPMAVTVRSITFKRASSSRP